MSGDIEGIGAAVTAGLAGRAVEPRHGGGQAAHEGARCLNCGTSLAGSHCHHCGQRADVHRSFGAIGHDLVHAIFHFEGKIWHTLPLLAVRPGELTRRYIAGERARFVSPMALFLFSVFLARPCPFYILDEVEAALDEFNIGRFLALLRSHAGRAQFIVVTHQKRTMEAADTLYGVSMGDDGVSKVISRRLPGEVVTEARDADAA